METIKNGKKKEDGASRDLGEAEHKTGEVKETSKDVVTQLTEENGDLRRRSIRRPPI